MFTSIKKWNFNKLLKTNNEKLFGIVADNAECLTLYNK